MPFWSRYPSIPQVTAVGGSLPSGPDYQPVPNRQTPPWGEPAMFDDPPTDLFFNSAQEGIYDGPAPMAGMPVNEPMDDERLHNRINIAYGHVALQLDHHGGNDDQFGYPPPGAPNEQEFQSGHTQVSIINPSSEQGWGTDPAFAWPRYPHMENKFAGYSSGIFRRNGQWQADKLTDPLYGRMQQERDKGIRHALMHRLHEVIVQDAPTVTNVQNVQSSGVGGLMFPLYDASPLGEQGVTPDGLGTVTLP